DDVARLRPALRAAAHFGHLFSELGLQPNDPAVGHLASTLETLFLKQIVVETPPSNSQTGSSDVLVQQSIQLKHTTPVRRSWQQRTLSQAKIADYQQRINQITNRCAPSGWFHSLDLGNGLFTLGHCSLEAMRRHVEWLQFPDLTGQSFLDLGSWDG